MKPVIFGLSGHTLTDDERDFFREADPLGYILFKRNCGDRAQMRAGAILPRITDDIEPFMDRVRALTTHELRDVIAVQREISDAVMAANGYPATANQSVTA